MSWTVNIAALAGGVGGILGLTIVSQSVLIVIILRKRNTKLRIQSRLVVRKNLGCLDYITACNIKSTALMHPLWENMGLCLPRMRLL